MTSERTPRLSPSGARLSCDPGCLSGASGVGCCVTPLFEQLGEDMLIIAGDPETELVSISATVEETTDCLEISGVLTGTGEGNGVAVAAISIDGTIIPSTQQGFGISILPANASVQYVVCGLSVGTHDIGLEVASLGSNLNIRAATASGENASLKVDVNPAP